MTESFRPSRDVVNRIFGEALPEVADEERDSPCPVDTDRHERWLLDNVPPHHE